MKPFLFVFIAFTLVINPVLSPAYAYIGPGMGVALVWTLLGPLAALITLIALIAYFPIRYYYKKHKKRHQDRKERAESGDRADHPDDNEA